MISKGNHVKFARFVPPGVSEEAKKWLGLGKGYQPQPTASADNLYLEFDYSGYHKNLIQ